MRALRPIWIAAVVALASGCGYSETVAGAARQVQPAEGRDDDDASSRRRRSKIDDARPSSSRTWASTSASTKAEPRRTAQKALDEYKARAHQLELIKERFEKLKAKLDELTKLGLAVNIRHNRMVISLPGDVLFDSGRETLKKDGQGHPAEGRRHHQGGPAARCPATTRSPATPTTSPSQRGPFKDNWGLSLMRAREVLVFLVDPAKGGQLPVAALERRRLRRHRSRRRPTTPTTAGRRTAAASSSSSPSVEEMLDLKAITQ